MEDILVQYKWIEMLLWFRVVLCFIILLGFVFFGLVIRGLVREKQFPKWKFMQTKYIIGFSIVGLLAIFLTAFFIPSDIPLRMSLATQISHELKNDKLLPEERELLVRLFTNLSTKIAKRLDTETPSSAKDKVLLDQFLATLDDRPDCSKDFKDK